MVEAVIFDIGGVLLDFKKDDTLEYVANSFDITFDDVKKNVYSDLDLLQKSKISEREYWSRFAFKVNRQLPENYGELWPRQIANVGVNNSMSHLILELRAGRYKVGALSNTINSHAGYLRSVFNQEIFDVFALSSEIGMRKPEKEAYMYVIDRLKINPEDGVFIDDSEGFVTAAENCGLTGILFENENQLRSELSQLKLI